MIVACAPSPTSSTVARGDQARLLAGAGEHQQQRLGELRALGDAHQRAVGHEGGVERDHRLLARRARADRRIAGGLPERERQRPDLEALAPCRGGQLRPVRAVDEHDAVGIERRQAFQRGVDLLTPSPASRRRSPAAAPPSARSADRCTSTPRCAGAASRAPRTRRWPPCAPRQPRVRPAASRRQPRSSRNRPARPWSSSQLRSSRAVSFYRSQACASALGLNSA